jgi:hypothetical protein
MSDIPGARKEIFQIVDELIEEGDLGRATRLINAIEKLRRRPAARRAPVRSAKFDSTIRSKIIYLANGTDLQSSEIAAHVKVNPGRVSEVLQGDR